jgi:hypothetical protein
LALGTAKVHRTKSPVAKHRGLMKRRCGPVKPNYRTLLGIGRSHLLRVLRE